MQTHRTTEAHRENPGAASRLEAVSRLTIDLAPYVGASLEVMDRDARKMRGERPFVFSDLKSGRGLDHIVRFIETQGMLACVAAA